ncbi:hypothetical protein RclHR1_02920014 [Rhizophagus clarus]|uniref:Protein kinase domain-containing protein n=1 Tax=Rhizophagus clarus TaxID=94130 RepID=A0A2Z6RIM8_9GLOM|nr:hypothetical protein RclHR1_02920014 [Rhizophagus clarus]
MVNLKSLVKVSKLKNTNHGKCSYCNKPFTEELWCKKCDPFRMIEGWTSGNNDIDKFIKDTIYEIRGVTKDYEVRFLEWVPFDKFKDIKQIGEGGFAKVYSATWIDGKAYYKKQDDGSWKKREPKSLTVALKRLNGSQNMSVEYLNELKTHWNYYKKNSFTLDFYGITKDPETKEFMMILQFAEKGNLRSSFLKDFNEKLWRDKLLNLFWISANLNDLHELKYIHKDFHSGNILQISDEESYISDFGLSGPSNKQKSDDKICGVLPYIAPEVLNGEPYTLSSDIYSFGVIMAEFSSGKPPFYNRKHDVSLALDICNGLRPEFGKGTPEFYKKLAYKCMNANSNQRPTAIELFLIIAFWKNCLNEEDYQEKEEFGYKGKEVKAAFEEADKEIPNISTLYKKNPDAIYTSRLFTFNNLAKPVNSSIITSYLDDEENNEDNQDSQLVDLEVSSSLLQSKDDDIDNENSVNN